MFIKPDDHIIIMEDDFYDPFNDEDIKMLIDAGVGIVHIPHAICWDKIYERNSPHLEWYSLDSAIEKYLKYDLRLTIPFFYTMPRWFPSNWYIDNTKPEPDCVTPNYANEELGQAIDNFAGEVLDHLRDVSHKIQLTYAIPSLGEFLWDGVMPDPYPTSDENVHNFIINRQKMLVKQHGEIWLYLHNFMGGSRNWNNTRLPFLYQALKYEFMDVPIYSVQFAHFAVGISPTNWECQSMITKYHDEYGIEFFVGSGNCGGLSTNFDAMIKQKARGFFTAPLMQFFANNEHIQPWMVEAIKKANRKFEEINGN